MSGIGEREERQYLGFQSQQRLASGGGNGGDTWRHFSRNMAGALVQTRVQRTSRRELGRGAQWTWALEVADSAPETWPHPSFPPCECGQASQALERWFPPLWNSTNHISLTGRACSLDIQYLGDLVNFGSCFENLLSYTISASQAAWEIWEALLWSCQTTSPNPTDELRHRTHPELRSTAIQWRGRLMNPTAIMVAATRRNR